MFMDKRLCDVEPIVTKTRPWVKILGGRIAPRTAPALETLLLYNSLFVCYLLRENFERRTLSLS